MQRTQPPHIHTHSHTNTRTHPAAHAASRGAAPPQRADCWLQQGTSPGALRSSVGSANARRRKRPGHEAWRAWRARAPGAQHAICACAAQRAARCAPPAHEGARLDARLQRAQHAQPVVEQVVHAVHGGWLGWGCVWRARVRCGAGRCGAVRGGAVRCAGGCRGRCWGLWGALECGVAGPQLPRDGCAARGAGWHDDSLTVGWQRAWWHSLASTTPTTHSNTTCAPLQRSHWASQITSNRFATTQPNSVENC
jgi:hypothetical protein